MLKTFQKFYHFLFRYRKAFLLFWITLALSVIASNLAPYILKLLIEAIPSQDYQLLLRIVFLFVGVKVVATLFSVLSSYIGDKTLLPASRDARLMIFKKVQDLDFAFHVNKRTGALISIFKRGDRAFFSLFHDLHIHIANIFISLLVTLFFFSKVDFSLVFLMLLVFCGNALISWQLIKLNIEKRKTFNRSEDEISGIITDSLINYETVKFFAQEKKEENRLKKKFKPWLKKLWDYAKSFRLMDIVVGTLSNLGILGVLWLVIQKLLQEQISAGDLVMVVSFITSFYYRFFELLYNLRDVAKDYVDLERYFGILNNEILVKDPKRPAPIKKVKGKIEFRNVTFSYPDSKEKVLKNISLSIEPGESVAFVGRSGSGKTTIIRLLLRFYDVDKGRVLIDGIDIRDLTKAQLRSFIGVVPQEPILFNNTIGFNVAYGNPEVKKEEIVKAVEIAHLNEFIENLPLKLETPVGERGIKLSGGQKQRLAIARMLLTEPNIIIFDEATSNLDSESEKLIQDSLWKIAKGRTVLIIAHRLSTVRKADRIVVLEEDSVVEEGTHQELIKKKGLYSYFWYLQAKGQPEESSEILG